MSPAMTTTATPPWISTQIFSSTLPGKPRHVTPQINRLGKTSTVLRVSTHIFGISEEIMGKCLFLELGM